MHSATTPVISRDNSREEIKQAFIAQRGYWRPWVETLLQEAPQFVAQYARYAGYPAQTGPLTERMVELVYVALDASSSHLFEVGLVTHMKRALEVGASASEIFEVLHLVALQGVTCVGLAAEILQDLAPEPVLSDAESLTPDAGMTAAETAHGMALRAVAQMDPAYARVLLDFAEQGLPANGLLLAERCLIQLALHACFTAFQPTAVRMLMTSALQLGCSKAEIFQVIQLGAHLSVHGTALGATVYAKISQADSSIPQ